MAVVGNLVVVTVVEVVVGTELMLKVVLLPRLKVLLLLLWLPAVVVTQLLLWSMVVTWTTRGPLARWWRESPGIVMSEKINNNLICEKMSSLVLYLN